MRRHGGERRGDTGVVVVAKGIEWWTLRWLGTVVDPYWPVGGLMTQWRSWHFMQERSGDGGGPSGSADKRSLCFIRQQARRYY